MKTKRERFVVVAERRTRRILRDLKLLGNCSNRGAYEFSQADVRRIFAALKAAINESHSRFSDQAPRVRQEFNIETGLIGSSEAQDGNDADR